MPPFHPLLPDPPRRTSFDVVREGINYLQSHLGLWVAATLVLLAINSVLTAPLTIVQQEYLQEIQRSGKFNPGDWMMFFRAPYLWWLFAAIPFTALFVPFRTAASRMALRGVVQGAPPNFSDLFTFDGRFWSLAIYGLIEGFILGVGTAAFLLPAILVYPFLVVGGLLVLENRLSPLDAIRVGSKAIAPNYLAVFGATLVAGLYACLGLLLCCVGFVFTAAIIEIVPALIYRDLFYAPTPGVDADGARPTFEA